MISDELVIDDGAPLLVPQHGHRDAAGEFRVGRKIDLGKLRFAVDRVRSGAALRAEHPTVSQHQRLDDRHRDCGFQFLELAEDERAMRPRTGQRDIEMITAGRRSKTARSRRSRAAVRRHPIAKVRLRPHKAAIDRSLDLVRPHSVNQLAHKSLPSSRSRRYRHVLRCAGVAFRSDQSRGNDIDDDSDAGSMRRGRRQCARHDRPFRKAAKAILHLNEDETTSAHAFFSVTIRETRKIMSKREQW